MTTSCAAWSAAATAAVPAQAGTCGGATTTMSAEPRRRPRRRRRVRIARRGTSRADHWRSWSGATCARYSPRRRWSCTRWSGLAAGTGCRRRCRRDAPTCAAPGRGCSSRSSGSRKPTLLASCRWASTSAADGTPRLGWLRSMARNASSPTTRIVRPKSLTLRLMPRRSASACGRAWSRRISPASGSCWNCSSTASSSPTKRWRSVTSSPSDRRVSATRFVYCEQTIKTVFLARYLHDRALRVEINDGLNVVEQWNSANDFIFFARRGEVSSNRREDQELSMLSLHLLQNCMVYVNTLMVQQVLARPAWQGRLSARDLHALTPLFWTHVNPYGRFELDMRIRISALEPPVGVD